MTLSLTHSLFFPLPLFLSLSPHLSFFFFSLSLSPFVYLYLSLSISLYLSISISLSRATGMFHRVILMSGSALNPWALVPDPASVTIQIGNQVRQ